MSKRILLFAAALKPAKDIRHIKLSNGLDEKFSIHFCGSETTDSKHELKTHIWNYNNSILNRISIRNKYKTLLLNINPDIIILSSLELAPVTLKYCQKHSAMLIYDIQENIGLNLRVQKNHQFWKELLFKNFQKKWENQLIKKANLCILAEECYKNQIELHSTPTILIENKALQTKWRVATNQVNLQYCFTGTLSINSGVDKALNWFINQNFDKRIKLEIVGHAVDDKIHRYLMKMANKYQFITYKGKRSPLPYNLIKETIMKSSFGIISYRSTAANREKLPTKLFEYCAMKLPIISLSDGRWNAYIKKHNAGIIMIDETLNANNLPTTLYDNFKATSHLFSNEELINYLTTTRKH